MALLELASSPSNLQVLDMDTYRAVEFLLYLFPGPCCGPESYDDFGPIRNRHPKILDGLGKARSIRMANKVLKTGAKQTTGRSRPYMSAGFHISTGAAS
jgi:hypothetical protein